MARRGLRPIPPFKDYLFRAVVFLTLAVIAVGFGLSYNPPPNPSESQREYSQISPQSDLPETFWEKLREDPTAFFTMILALLTATLAVGSVAQIGFLIRADQTARNSAEAALKSANVAVAQSRPWISYNKIAIGGDLRLRSSTIIATIDFTIRNYGSIPANDVVVFGNIVHFDADKGIVEVNRMVEDIRRNPVYIGKSLFPGDEILVHCHFLGEMDKAISAVKYYGDYIPFIIVGRIDYKSTLISESHFTNFTLQIGRRDEAAGINPYDGEIGRDMLFVTEWFRGPIAN